MRKKERMEVYWSKEMIPNSKLTPQEEIKY